VRLDKTADTAGLAEFVDSERHCGHPRGLAQPGR